MNTREQYLIKQNERLQAQLQVVLAAMNNAAEESEFRASVACAFAWDLMVEHMDYSEDAIYRTWASWDQAVANMEKASDEARGVRRAADGSIISILPSTEMEK